jgi:aldose 1-epimerase
MAFRVRLETRVAGSRDGTIYVLEDDSAGERAAVWPGLGFNCFDWQATLAGTRCSLLYADPQLFADGRPTRSGIPILFPFPNRIRAGKFDWQGKTYALPLNDSTTTNAIHGFACRKPWRVLDQGASATEAWLSGEFQGSVDAPESLACWPADYRIRVTYRLSPGRLRLDAVVSNPDSKPLPFGLGYHPYFSLPFTPKGAADMCTVQVPARKYWELLDSLPTGERLAVDTARDLNTARLVKDLKLDDVLADLPPLPQEENQREGAVLRDERGGVQLQVFCSQGFREMVVFTPAHRQAFCVEPYTCVTDAVNLQARGVDAGWLVLTAGATWSAQVELAVNRLA